MLHDTIMRLVVVLVIIALSVDLEVHDPGRPAVRPRTSGSARRSSYDEPADPGTISFIPRPDWYFYFLFYLLRIFKWPETVILGTVGVPTSALLAPDRDAVHRPRAERRPSAPAGGDGRGGARDPLDGRLHVEGRDREGVARLRARARRCRSGRRSRASRTTRPRSRGRRSSPRAAARTATPISATAASNLGAPDLSRLARAAGRGVLRRYVADPQSGNNVMPKYGKQAVGAFTAPQLLQLGGVPRTLRRARG